MRLIDSHPQATLWGGTALSGLVVALTEVFVSRDGVADAWLTILGTAVGTHIALRLAMASRK